jgi:hypothetical protein
VTAGPAKGPGVGRDDGPHGTKRTGRLGHSGEKGKMVGWASTGEKWRNGPGPYYK